MNLFGVMDISASALQAERVRAEVVASNMANAETTRTADGTPYQRHHVVFESQDASTFGQALLSQANPSGLGLSAAIPPGFASTSVFGIQVPADSLDKARMEVAAKGMPQSGRLGFELFDKPNWVGSEFDEHVNYQRALEGELEHTIGTLGVVRSARVHLAMPQQSLFTQDQKPAKASVILRLKRASLPTEQADSIRNLVAGAIENLTPDQVTLVDADGRVSFNALLSTKAQPIDQAAENLIPLPAAETAVLEFHALDGPIDPEPPAIEPEPEPRPPAPDPALLIDAMIATAREEATEKTCRLMEDYTEAHVIAERRRILEVCERFMRDRQRYFAVAEEQVVRLALAIASRILHREAQADPLLLAGTVRAALARIQEGSGSVLRVPPDEVAMWLEIFPIGIEPIVQISADARMQPGDCALETMVGRVDFGIEVQLAEIARGFSELASPTSAPMNEVQG